MPAHDSRQGVATSAAPFSLYLLLCCAWLLSPLPAAADSCPADRIDERVRVSHVYDGDTVRLQDGRRVRLIGINTPETRKQDSAAEPFADAARSGLSTLLDRNNRTLLLKHGSERHDHYGRLLAHAFLESGDNVAALLLARGLATTLVVPPNTWGMDCYQRVEDSARTERTGLWALQQYQARDSEQLSAGANGFAIVHGSVRGVRTAGKGVWIDLAGPLSLHISQRDRDNFKPGYLEQLAGHRVEARGWIKPERQGLRMNIRHPAALAIITAGPARDKP